MLPDSCQEIADEKVHNKNYPHLVQDISGVKVCDQHNGKLMANASVFNAVVKPSIFYPV